MIVVCCTVGKIGKSQDNQEKELRIKCKEKKSAGKCEVFSTRPEWHLDPPSLLYKRYRVIPGVKRPGRDLTIHPYLARG